MADKIVLAPVFCVFPRPLEPHLEPAGTAATDAGPVIDDGDPRGVSSGQSTGLSAPEDGQGRAAHPASILTDRPTINCAVDVLPFFWMPAKTLARRAQQDGIPYPDWVRDDHV